MKPLPLLLAFACLMSSATADLTEDIATASASKSFAVQGPGNWLFLKQELAYLAKGALTTENSAAATKAISQYHEALAAEGVQLIVVPIPAKAEIYPDKLSANTAPTALKNQETAFIAALTKSGVNVIDLATAFHKSRQQHPETLLYCERDSHWAPAGVKLTSDLILAKLGNPAWARPAKPLSAPETIEIAGDLMITPETQKLGVEKVTLLRTQPLVKPVAEAPLILLGDSHALVFQAGANAGYHCEGAGLLDLLQAKLGQPLTLVASEGGGSDQARRNLLNNKSSKRADFWSTRKVVIWCFTSREVLQKDWTEIKIK